MRRAVLDVWRVGRSTARRDGQLPEALERMASSLRAGHSLRGSLGEVAAATADPLGAELQRAAGALEHGADLERALDTWSRASLPSPDVALAVTALGLGGHAGGGVARALDRVAATLRERRELRAEVRALATQARASAGVLTVAPLAFAVLVSAIEPGIPDFLLTTPVGLACLAVGLVLDALGAVWMARIVRDAA